MKNFVKFIQQLHEEKISVVLEKLLVQKTPVALMILAQIAQAIDTAKELRNQGLNVTNLVVIDHTPPPVDMDFNVVHVNDVANIYPKPEYVFATSWGEYKFAEKYFGGSKIIRQSPIRGFSPDKVFEIFIEHLPELHEVYESLIDEESKKTFCGYWLGCITNQASEVVYANTLQYICPGFLPKTGDIVIDCGSYDGSTAARFVNMGCKVYGFELDRKNFERAVKLAKEKNFVVENFGLGAYKHTAKYNSSGGAGTKLNFNGSDIAQITTIDNYVGEKNLPRVDFIKMDVEGAELDVLKGAATTIARFKPILALSAYHKLDDFWTLTNFIKSIRPDYEFGLRQYASTPEDIADWFYDDILELYTYYKLDINSPNYEECVLFAR